MTCNGCRNHVQETLVKVKGVTVVSVDLEKEEATIEMENHIPIYKLQEALKNGQASEQWTAQARLMTFGEAVLATIKQSNASIAS